MEDEPIATREASRSREVFTHWLAGLTYRIASNTAYVTAGLLTAQSLDRQGEPPANAELCGVAPCVLAGMYLAALAHARVKRVEAIIDPPRRP